MIAFPDAEALPVRYLRAVLPTHRPNALVDTKVPSPRKDQMVIVRRVGGTRRNVVTDAPLLAFECWGKDDDDAWDLARLVRALVWEMRGTVQNGVTVYVINEAAGPANLPDPISGQSRVTFTNELLLRGSTTL